MFVASVFTPLDAAAFIPFRRQAGGRRLLEGGVYSYNNRYVAKQFIVRLDLVFTRLYRCSQALICLLSRQKGLCRPRPV